MRIKEIIPRFKARKLCNKIGFDFPLYNLSHIEKYLLKLTQKDIILDYSQLRIGLLHYLNVNLPKDSYIATTSYTIYDMINVIINSNNKPILVDISPKDLSPNLDSLIYLVRSEKVKCVIFTYLHGYRVDISKLSDACKEKECILIEDCAQSLWIDEKFKVNKQPGSFGDIALFSTGFYKNINTISGGLLLLNSNSKGSLDIIRSHEKLSKLISLDYLNRLLYGIFFTFITNKFIFSLIIFPILKLARLEKIEMLNKRAREENNPRYIHRKENDILRMNFIQRIFLKMQSKEILKVEYTKRSRLGKCYLEELSDLIYRRVIEIPGLDPNKSLDSFKEISSYNQIPVLFKNRNKLLNFLVKNDIDIAEQHIKNLSSINIYSVYTNNTESNCYYSEKVSEELFLLPCYPEFPISKAKEISKLIKDFVNCN